MTIRPLPSRLGELDFDQAPETSDYSDDEIGDRARWMSEVLARRGHLGHQQWTPEDVRPRIDASPLTTRAIAAMRAAVIRRDYDAIGPAPYEVWFWLNAVIPAPEISISSVGDESESFRAAAAMLRERGAPGDRSAAAELEARADDRIKRGRGKPADPRRRPGGYRAFLLIMQTSMSIGNIVDLIYAADRDWYPWAPVTHDELRSHGWLGAADRTGHHSIEAARLRLTDAIKTCVKRERDAWGIITTRGGRRR